MGLASWLWILTVVFCGAFLLISWKVSKKAVSSYAEYVIGGGTFPLFLIFFTQFATIMGVGNFVGHASKGYELGLPHLFFVLGEQGSKIIFALFFAGLAGRFTYKTFSEMIDDLMVRDKVTRILVGLIASLIMIAWVGGQGKGFGLLFKVITGADETVIILLFSAVFIIYTAMGGIHSVVWTDLLQGIMVLIFGTYFYITAFSTINFSFATLGERLTAVGKANLWTLSGVDPIRLVTMFVVGCVGILVAQIYWQRCFAAKDSKTARNGLLWSGIIAVVMVMLTAIVGMIIMTLNPGLKPGDAMSWYLHNYVPVGVAAMIFVLILAAGMSSADSNLNSAVTLIVNDLIVPLKKDATDKWLVKMSVILTVVLGVFAALAALYATSIIGLFSQAYTLAGGAITPLLLVGLIWKKRRNEKFEMGKRNSNVTAWGARVGIVAGAVLTQIKALGPNRILIALVVSAILVVLVSLATKEKEAAAA